MTLFPMSAVPAAGDDPRLPRCGRCGLHSGCRSPRMPVSGEGRRGALVVAEAPGEEEDRQNTQLIGPSGRVLRRYLREIDVDLDRDCWKTNAVICCPHRNPTEEEVLSCRPNLLRAVRELKPTVVVLLGGPAIRSLVGWLWRDGSGGFQVGRWVGWRIPSQQLNAWVCPTYHPSYVTRTENSKEAEAQVISIFFRKHLRRVFELEGRPWTRSPEREKRVRLLMTAEEAVRGVESLTRARPKVPVAFDFETNMLKPDSERAEVFSCALSNGEDTVAFPMVGGAVEAVRRFLQSPVPKVAHNLKFEDRWCRAVLKTPVKNWWWCTMQTAHVLDNRRGISGLKFQAFVRLGQPSYNDRVSPYLEGSSNEPNRIKKAPVRDVLLYNGMDALLTWELFRKQEEQLA